MIECTYNTMWEPIRSVFLFTLWGPLQVSFFAYYMWALRSVSVHTIWDPLRSVSSLTMCPPPLRSVSSLTIYEGPFRSVSLPTI